MHTDATWCGQYVRAKHNLAFEPVTVMGSAAKCFREAETTPKLFLGRQRDITYSQITD